MGDHNHDHNHDHNYNHEHNQEHNHEHNYKHKRDHNHDHKHRHVHNYEQLHISNRRNYNYNFASCSYNNRHFHNGEWSLQARWSRRPCRTFCDIFEHSFAGLIHTSGSDHAAHLFVVSFAQLLFLFVLTSAQSRVAFNH